MDLCYKGFGQEVQNIHLERYMRVAKIVNERAKLEILMFLNKSVDVLTSPDSFTAGISSFLVETAERKVYLDATRFRDSLLSDAQDRGDLKVLLMKSNRLGRSIPIQPSYRYVSSIPHLVSIAERLQHLASKDQKRLRRSYLRIGGSRMPRCGGGRR